MGRAKRRLYDAFPTRAGAKSAAKDVAASAKGCDAIVRKLKRAQDGGRLKYGVYVRMVCRL